MMPSVMDERHEEIRSESISSDHLSEKSVARQFESLIPWQALGKNGTDLSECPALGLWKSTREQR
jgi:hypothetical protein